MKQISEQDIEKIIKHLKEGKNLPDSYKAVLFDTKREYELVYAGKEREEDILAETMAMPLQKVKTFRNGENENGWMNMLIFGDNLQFLKTLLQMKQEGKLNNADGTPGIRLIYIDPPFATRQEFKGSRDQKAYQDKIAGARFLEFLRKRLVFLRELLSADGSIYVHLDWKKVHYIKTLMDEIFDEQNFLNEVIWYYRRWNVATNLFARNHDCILYYAKNAGRHVFNNLYIPKSQKSSGNGRAWKSVFDEEGRRHSILLNEKSKGTPMPDMWEISIINPVAHERTRIGYPTQKPEALLDRVIKASSNPGDLVLDCFAGSGTTLAVAEKLGRRWIGVDCGKLAIYTMQKRFLNIAESKNLENPKKKYGKPPKPFNLYNNGLYDYKMIKELPWEQYRDFALKLFQCRDERHEISKIELDGYLGAESVLVFNYYKHKDSVLDRGFIDDLHKYLGDKIGRRFFIIAPAASVGFLEDYIEKGKTKYFILRIPYSIIEEIHKIDFTTIKQPISEMEVNDTIDSVGFDFIQLPNVECQYLIENKKGQVELGTEKDFVIKIETFESKIMSRKPIDFANHETLSMVMLDYDFDREVFNMDEVFYAEDLKKNDYEVHFDEDKIKGQIMIIYLDIFGNEKREVKVLSDFKVERKK